MGAGNQKEHYIQDAAEKYAVYRLQKLAAESNLSITNDYFFHKKEYEEYCRERGISEDFKKSKYKKICDTWLPNFFNALRDKHPKSKFDFVDVESEFRNLGKKGDILVKFSDGTPDLSFSLKNYEKGWGRPQLCSGTWFSFLINMLLPKSGSPGMIVDPDNPELSYKAANNIEKTKKHMDNLGYLTPEVEGYLDWCMNTLSEVRTFYVNGDEAKNWSGVSEKWKNDCETLGLRAIEQMSSALKSIPSAVVKERLIEMAGLSFDEELLLLGPKGYLSSYHNEKYRQILNRVASSNCTVDCRKNKKSLSFVFMDQDGEVVNVEIPFTLQKNGAWYLPKEKYEGLKFHEKEKINLAYGDRRPKKSKEINTSINTYLNLNKALKQ